LETIMPKRTPLSARVRLLPGKASNYIRHWDDEIQPGDNVFLCCRVSAIDQKRRGNLDDQEAVLREAAARSHAHVIGVHKEQTSGFDTIWLAGIPERAKERKAKIVAVSTDRFVRHPAYHSKRWPDARAREPDLKYLKYVTDGVVLVTLAHPDATFEEVRSIHTKRGQRLKGRKGGRPPKPDDGSKKRRRIRLQPRVQKMRRNGATLGEITKETGVPRSTVARWVRG
jgi:DNA invertase Pin-like site-specific DNA recombinase